MIDKYKEYLFYVYLFIVLLCVVAGAVRYKKTDAPTKTIYYLLCIMLISECATRIFSKAPIYHVYTVVELWMITIYFLQTTVKKMVSALTIAATIVYPTLAILNVAWAEDPSTLNAHSITVESFAVIVMSLYALYKILINDSIDNLFKHVHFWLWTCFLTYFSSTFFFWSTIKILYKIHSTGYVFAVFSQIIMNILVYLAILLIFIFYPKNSMPKEPT
ncbi:MAG: hypothetical protein K9G49_02515 [Taibaiella sp.]|nr:hypothetical protein [Taibaiella sp.]